MKTLYLTKDSLPAFVMGCLVAHKLTPSFDSELGLWEGNHLDVFMEAKAMTHRRIEREGKHCYINDLMCVGSH